MSEFELLDTAGDISGKLRLIYGSGPTDPAPFVLTLTRKLRLSDFSCPDLVEAPQYVARALGTTPPVPFHEIEKYADDIFTGGKVARGWATLGASDDWPRSASLRRPRIYASSLSACHRGAAASRLARAHWSGAYWPGARRR
jgi:hypothetical protein